MRDMHAADTTADDSDNTVDDRSCYENEGERTAVYLNERLRDDARVVTRVLPTGDNEYPSYGKIGFYLRSIYEAVLRLRDDRTRVDVRRFRDTADTTSRDRIAISLGELFHVVGTAFRDAAFNDTEARFVRSVFVDDAGDFLRRYADSLDDAGSVISDIERFVEICCALKGDVRVRCSDDANDLDARTYVQLGGGRIRASRNDRYRPLLYPISASAVCAHVDRARRAALTLRRATFGHSTLGRDGSNDVGGNDSSTIVELPHANDGIGQTTDNDDEDDNDRSKITFARKYTIAWCRYSEWEKRHGDNNDANKYGRSLYLQRAKLFNAYGRLAVIEPKLFVARIEEV